MAKKPIIKTIEEKLTQKATVVYIVKCKCLQGKTTVESAKERYFQGLDFTEHNVPELVKANAKSLDEVYPIWEAKMKKGIAEAENLILGYKNDPIMVTRLKGAIEHYNLQLKNFASPDRPEDKITEEMIFAELEIPVLKTVRLE